MTTSKKVTSIICIISLILAITLGIALSVGAKPNTYDGTVSARLSATDVTINAESSVRVGDIPGDAVAIATADELQSFINGEGAYGYLTEDISLDWAGVGAQAYLASGRTLDGNGHTLTLADAQAIANVSNKTGDGASLSGTDGVVQGIQSDFTNPLDGTTNTAKCTYGLLVDFNMGTIKNFKFVYNQAEHSVANNSGTQARNYAGIVCGTNSGTISNCDLTVSGEFGYYYCSGSASQRNDVDYFATIVGGIAGRNGGVITNITAQYSAFNMKLNTRGQNSASKLMGARASAKSVAGGIAGVMYSTASECSNIIVTATSDVVYSLIAQRQNATMTNASAYREVAAVVPGNSSYSQAEGGIGETEDTQAKVDNIIVDFQATNNGLTVGDCESINAVVHCGKNTNVTMIRTTDKVVKKDDVTQHVDYQTDHCNCGVAGNSGQHEAGYGNVINTGDRSIVTVGFDENNNQVITVEPKDKVNTMLGEVSFGKYDGRGTVTDSSMEPGLDDTATYTDVMPNGSTYLYAQENVRFNSYSVTIRPYQSKSSKYWEYSAYSYEIATISNVGSSSYTYTGKDFLTDQFSYTTVGSSVSGVANPQFFNARTDEDMAVTEARLPGTYTFKLQPKEVDLAYIDTDSKVVVYAESDPTEYSFEIGLAQITPIDASLLADNWLTTVNDFTFELAGGIDGAADGYAYEVNGSQPTPVTGLVMQNRVDTSSSGRTYSVYLTSGRTQVTEVYTYTVKIDLTDPTAEITHYEHPTDMYFTHNVLTLSVSDRASGVVSIVMNTYNDQGAVDHTHDIMSEGTDNGDGSYTWKFEDTGRREIVVTDAAGHSATLEVNVKIDKTQPVLDVEAYYFVDEQVENGTDTEGNPIYTAVPRKVEYVSGTEVTSSVYFDATATFGESGGQIRYSLDNGATWNVYDGTLVVKRPSQVKFRAVANTYDHPDGDVYPYPNRYPLVNNWDNKTVQVVIQLEHIAITIDDIIISDATKPFDGTDAFLGSVSVRAGFEDEKGINGVVEITSVAYADVNAGDEVALVIEVACTDDTKFMDNLIVGANGAIEKKSVDIVIDDQQKIYGVTIPELTYTQTGMVEGFEESIDIYVVMPDGCSEYELLPTTSEGNEYVITAVSGIALDNYTIGSVTDGKLTVTLATVDRLVYSRGEFTGLDLNNIADRNLEIGITLSDGNYQRLNVEFFARYVHIDQGTGNIVDEGYTLKVDDIATAGAGFFRVVISLPEYDESGELLTDKYVLDNDVSEFMIKIIDSTIFDTDQQVSQDTQQSGNTQQSDPVVVNSANEYVGVYEETSKGKDNTDVTIEQSGKNKDRITMVSIFCAVAIVVAFAMGVGNAIRKRARR